MTVKGHVENGMLVFDEPVELPEGAVFQIDLKRIASSKPGSQGVSLAERLSPIIGSVEGLPEDASINHDHYLYGAPKK